MLYIHRKNNFYTCYLGRTRGQSTTNFSNLFNIDCPIVDWIKFFKLPISIDIAYDNYDILVRDCPNKHGNFVNKHIRFYE